MSPPYAERTGRMRIGDDEISYANPPGLPAAESGDDAMALCGRHLRSAADERILLLGCGHGALGVALARAAHRGGVTLCDPSLTALGAARRTLELGRAANAAVSEAITLLPELAGELDRVVLLAPQSRALARRWMVEALALLRPGGALTLAGANKGGIQPQIGDAAALFGAADTLGVGRGCRVAEAIRPPSPPEPPAWAATPGIAPGTWHSLLARLPAGERELVSLPGVFSYDHIDPGTELLLRSLPLPAGARVLDVGCGYGPIGVAAADAGAATVDMIDVSLLAVAAARANAGRYGLRGEVLAGDGLSAVAGRQYDLIVSNPPFHAGRQMHIATSEALIAGARALLAPGGRLALVANRFLPYKRMLAAHVRRADVLAENKAYMVLVGEV
jgi:16S rRNA (guanine1207-N2)-methyltransferase